MRQSSPLGKVIYAKDSHSIYEVDGEEHQASSLTCVINLSRLKYSMQLFAQNLSLFAKLFLDNKSVFYDVVSFNYYLLVHTPPTTDAHPSTPRIVGFFSKEKMSWDNNNLACILVFPPWQRKGLGKILMAVSYELSKRENRVGGPEKPLSELGKKGYSRFWETRIARTILGMKSKTTPTIGEIAEACWVLPEDVIATLKDMGLWAVKKKANGSLVVNKASIREWVKIKNVDLTPPIDDDGFIEECEPDTMDEET